MPSEFGICTQDIHRIVQAAMDHFGRIDILVYNAGGAKGQNIFDTSDEDWEEALTRLVKLVAPIMSQ